MKKYVQRNKNASDEYETPAEIFYELDAEFHFNLDPCSTDANRKCERHYTKEDDGLKHDWGGVQSVLQSTIQQYKKMGRKSIQREQKRPHPGRDADPGEDRHEILS